MRPSMYSTTLFKNITFSEAALCFFGNTQIYFLRFGLTEIGVGGLLRILKLEKNLSVTSSKACQHFIGYGITQSILILLNLLNNVFHP
jgi:hypothetical protein